MSVENSKNTMTDNSYNTLSPPPVFGEHMIEKRSRERYPASRSKVKGDTDLIVRTINSKMEPCIEGPSTNKGSQRAYRQQGLGDSTWDSGDSAAIGPKKIDYLRSRRIFRHFYHLIFTLPTGKHRIYGSLVAMHARGYSRGNLELCLIM